MKEKNRGNGAKQKQHQGLGGSFFLLLFLVVPYLSLLPCRAEFEFARASLHLSRWKNTGCILFVGPFLSFKVSHTLPTASTYYRTTHTHTHIGIRLLPFGAFVQKVMLASFLPTTAPRAFLKQSWVWYYFRMGIGLCYSTLLLQTRTQTLTTRARTHKDSRTRTHTHARTHARRKILRCTQTRPSLLLLLVLVSGK